MNQKKYKILLVDDSSFDRAIIEKRLIKLEYDVLSVSSGEDALREVLNTSFDMVLIDLMMEGSGGLETLKEIRKMFGLTDLPVIILTATEGDDDLVKAFDSGANDYLVKPVNFSAMMARINSLLAVKSATLKMHQSHLKAENVVKAKNKFLLKMTEKMQVPLNSVMGMIDLISTDNLDYNQKRHLDIIQKSGETLLSLVTDIMEISYMDCDEVDIVETDFDMSEVILDCFKSVLDKIQKKDVDLIYYLNNDVGPYLVGDAEKLKKIIVHLLMNAEKFTDHGEIFLHIAPSAVKDRIIISISDTGKGISESDLKNIFDHFMHDTSVPSMQYGSYGLGLSICKRNIELMGGDIIVESNLDEGTTVYLEIPFQKSLIPQDNTHIQDQISNMNDLTVLIIDDNQTTLHILSEILESWSVNVVTADSGEKGVLEILTRMKEKKTFDIILVDAVMPRMSGIDVIRRIDNSLPIDSEVILMLNSLPDEDELKSCMELNIDFTIIKPILDINLLTVFNDVIRKKNNVLHFDQLKKSQLTHQGNILIVDENQAVVDKLIENMSESQYSIFSSLDTDEAMTIIQNYNIDIVIMDYDMSCEFSDNIARDYFEAELFVQFIFSFNNRELLSDEIESRIFKDGNSSIVKSIESECLVKLIKRIMSKKEVA